MTASPISDLNPVFMAAGCKLTVMDKGNTHTHTHTWSHTHTHIHMLTPQEKMHFAAIANT